MEALGAGASIAQLVGNAGGLHSKTRRTAETARQNKVECENLAGRVSTINDVLPGLPEDPQVKRLLQELRDTLDEAGGLVVAWPKLSATKRFIRARRHADKFRELNARIDCHLSVFPLVGYAAIAGRLDRLFPADYTGVPPTTTATLTSLVSSSSSQQTQMVASDYPRMFKWAEIAAATDNFAVKLGGGSSETVYKGRLHGGPEVVVKVLKKQGQQCMENPFVAELEILFPLRHDHIVRLVGWCAEEEDRMFVYERDHMINGTLRDHLQGTRMHGGSNSSPVTASWRTRVEVLLGVSRAIEHMHRSAARRIIHRNVSSSNILLDVSWTPRLSGFGGAILQAAGAGGQVVAEVVGTPGYVDTEYSCTQRVSSASDVYSFGVLILEALTGEDPATLVDSVLPVIQNDNLQDVLDGRPATPSATQLEALELVACTAETCLWPQGKERPAMSNVVASLERALGIMTEQ